MSFVYDEKIIFDRVTLNVPNNAKIALVGDNGVGKTTLLRLIAGEIKPDNGTVTTGGIVAYVRQNTRDDTKSGGEITQREIESALYGPDTAGVLLLDEPTNNLDKSSRDWLVRVVKNFQGIVLFASHDRAFIDEVADSVAEIADQSLRLFQGNYLAYLERKNQEYFQQEALYDKQQQEKRGLQRQLRVAYDHMQPSFHKKSPRKNAGVDVEWAKGHKGATDARQKRVGTKISALKSKIDRVEQVDKPFERKSYRANIAADAPRRKLLIRLSSVGKSYNTPLFSGINLEVLAGDRWHIAGPNGSGKSTLLKIITGDLNADVGERFMATGVKLGYLSQEVLGLVVRQSGVENLEEYGDAAAILKAASTMDLSPLDMTKPVHALSRGQQTKLGILKLLLVENDIVILDEPTNHIDIRARENIERALGEYRGALVVVSHDEYFVGRLGVTQRYELGR